MCERKTIEMKEKDACKMLCDPRCGDEKITIKFASSSSFKISIIQFYD